MIGSVNSTRHIYLKVRLMILYSFIKGKEQKELENIIEKLRDKEALVVVEGKKDKLALQKLFIYSLTREQVIRNIELLKKHYKKAFVLTDLDKEGKRIAEYLELFLSEHGINVDTILRLKLFHLLKIRNIEGIYNAYLRIQKGV
jgi:5S rRNA maturation endonuclease (ribonuclease M5)